MANVMCFTAITSPKTPGVTLIGKSNARKVLLIDNTAFPTSPIQTSRSILVKADTNPGAKINSLVCSNCDGNGALACSQCQGGGVNLVDHFNGKFKAGALCWLCRGKKEMLCGDCNGAGFMGGFMSTFNE
ncbi:hypothetical protein ACHQM5_002530 [Ranunculus cassubicifolius]